MSERSGDGKIQSNDAVIYFGEAQELPHEREARLYNAQLNDVFSMAQTISVANEMVVPDRDIDFAALKARLSELRHTIPNPKDADQMYRMLRRQELDRKRTISSFRVAAGLAKSNKPVSEWTDAERESVGSCVFTYTTGKKPEGIVSLMHTPLAVTLHVQNLDDLHSYSVSKQAGGFYYPDAEVKPKFRKKHPGVFETPFALIAVQDPSVSLLHELGHALVETGRKAWETGSHPALSGWAKSKWSYEEFIQQAKNFDKYLKQWLEQNDRYEYGQLKKSGQLSGEIILEKWLQRYSSEQYTVFRKFLAEQILPRALSRAKEEIIVEFKQSGFKKTDSLSYAVDVVDENGPYNTLFEYIHSVLRGNEQNSWKTLIPELLRQYKDVFGVYEQAVSSWASGLENILNVYRDIGLFKRADLFGELMMTIPLEINPDASVFDNGMAIAKSIEDRFGMEMLSLRPYQKALRLAGVMEMIEMRLESEPVHIDEIPQNYRREVRRMESGATAREKYRRIVRKGKLLMSHVTREVQDHQLESLVPVMEKYDARLRAWFNEADILLTGKPRAWKKSV